MKRISTIIEATDRVKKKTSGVTKSYSACKRCQRRKQRCDGNYLTNKTCSKCLSANIVCEYNEKLSPNYSSLLEKKVDFLQKKIADLETQLQNEVQKNQSASNFSPGDFKSLSSTNSNVNNKSLVDFAARIPLKDDSNPIYIGSASFNIADLIQGYLNQDNLSSNETLNNEDYEDISGNPNNFVEILLEDINLMDYFLDSYLTIIHKRYPFLDKFYIEKLHNTRVELFFSNNEKNAINRFIILMIYAVGSYLRPNNSKTPHVSFARLLFYRAALNSDLSSVFKTETTLNINALILLVIYKLRTPNGQVIWYLIGMAVRLCIDFGLHRRNLHSFIKNPYKYLLDCRLFWSVYALDRIISNSFGRPHSISDRDIDIDLPIDVDESITDPNILKNVFYQIYPKNNIENFAIKALLNPPTSTLSLAIKNFELRKIDSKIHDRIYAVDQNFNEIPRDAINEIQEEMKTWINSIPRGHTYFDYNYYLYLFNKQIRYLIIPFIDKLEHDDPLFKTCIESSITVCKINRRIHDYAKHLLSIVSIQTVFLSGITIIYAVLSKKSKWDFNLSEGLRCCSSTLLLLSERRPSCKMYYNTFETLLNHIGNLNFSDVEGFQYNFYNFDIFGQNNLKSQLQNLNNNESMPYTKKNSNNHLSFLQKNLINHVAENDFSKFINNLTEDGCLSNMDVDFI